jgi:hypothetical protein
MGFNGRQVIKNYYSIDIASKSLINIFQNL